MAREGGPGGPDVKGRREGEGRRDERERRMEG